MSLVIKRSEAIRSDLNQYFTGKACPKGHVCNRYVVNYGCVDCLTANSLAWKSNNVAETSRQVRESYIKNYAKYLERKADYYVKNKKKSLLNMARWRANKKGIDFDITESDIDWVDVCPVLGIVLDYAVRVQHCQNSPTLDRFDNSLGYVRGNVNVVSFRANELKSNASPEEMLKVASYMTRKCGV